MKTVLIPWLLASSLFAAAPTVEIKVDQAGYLPTLPKVAFVAAKEQASEFTVRDAANGAVAFRGTLSAPADDADSGDRVQAADFSRLTNSGTYYVDVPGVGRSWNFAIGASVYSHPWYLAMRSYYGQRCGTGVDLGPEFPGFKHDACHLEGAWHSSSGKSGPRESRGGWHDAGDYGRYVVNSGISTGTLLWAWEFYGPRLARVKLDLPESGNGTPDILNEIRWNLDWMLTMQDTDGGVWHKQTSEKFCGFVMPEADKLVSYVVGTGAEPYKSSCATGDFAAVMAVAARVYKPYDAAFAARALSAAEKAYAWVSAHPDVMYRNPEGVGTGAYGDRSCADERLWAAAELYRTTGKSDYERYFVANYGELRKSIGAGNPQSWGNVADLALWTFALGGRGDGAAIAAIRQDSLAAADAIVERSAKNGYRISLTTQNYIWGSNSVVANYGMQLLVANAFRKDPRYVETALDNLHYLLGRNTFSLSFVTRVGANPFRHPHHRPSGADANEEPWPGLLSGGPNRAKQDPAMRKLPDGLPPAKSYIDDQEAYAANEVAINWNAPLVFLMAAALPEAPDLDAAIARERMGTLVIHTKPGARVSVEQMRHEFWFGATLPAGMFTGRNAPADIGKFQSTFLANFNAGVIESAFKWHEMEPRQGQVNYTAVDAILTWADRHGIPVRGHCIFWGIPNRVQDWVKALTPDGLLAALQQRGRDVGTHYRGRFADYDLNNEMIHANYYEEKLGPSITRQMAQAVKDGDPDARLCVNDYDVATGRRLDDYVKHIRRLLDDGVPISCIGVQGHLHADTVDFAELQRSLDTLAQFHLPIRVTEFNFPRQRSKFYTGDKRAVLTAEEERAKAEALREYYRICFAHPAVSGLLMWGFWEGANWIPQSSLYKRDWTATPAAEAYRDLVFKQWWTNWSGTANAKGEVSVRAFYGRYKVTADGEESVVELKRADGKK